MRAYVDKPKNDRSGQKIGSWTLLHISGVKRLKNAINNKHTVIWMYSCQCDCGNICDVGWPDIAAKRSTKCFDCHFKECVLNSQRCISNFKNKNSNYKGTNDIPHIFFSRAKKGAENRDIEFNISIEDMQNQWDVQKGLCYYTGIPLIFYMTKNIDRRENLSFKASLDRIDSNLGYTKENIAWTTKTINCTKLDLTKKAFLKMCELVYLYNKDKL